MSGKMAKRAREMKDAAMTPEQKIAGIVHRLCEDNSRAVNGLTPQVAFAIFGDVAMRMVYWLEGITQQPKRGLLLKEFATMLDHIARAELGELTDEEKAQLLEQVGAELPQMSAPSMDTDADTPDDGAGNVIQFVQNPAPAEEAPIDPSAQG